MSQVIVTEDKLSDKRKSSAEQERKIDNDSLLNKWRRNDITGKDPVAMVAGLAVLPLFAFWSFLVAIMTLIVMAFRGLMLVGGKLFPKQQGLIIKGE